jgi:hypothetical protein
MDLSSGSHGNFKVSAVDQQLSASPLRGHSPLSNSSQVGEGDQQDANSTKDDKAATEPFPYDMQQHNDAMAGSDSAAEDTWPTSYQRPTEQMSEARQSSLTGAQDVGEEAESFLSRPFERLDQLGLLTQFEQDAKETAEFEKGAAFNHTLTSAIAWLLTHVAPPELLLRMLELMVEFRVWAECRPTHENEVHSAKLIGDLDAIEERELNQGSFDPRCCYGVALPSHATLVFSCQCGAKSSYRNPDVISSA